MTNVYVKGGEILINGTLISPTSIQAIYQDKIVTYHLDFSRIIGSRTKDYIETEYYDVVVYGEAINASTVRVLEIFDSPEETNESIFRLFGRNKIKWVFAADKDFKDRVENLLYTTKNLQLFSSKVPIDIGADRKIHFIQTNVERFDIRFPKIFVSIESNGCRVNGRTEVKANFKSFQLAIGK